MVSKIKYSGANWNDDADGKDQTVYRQLSTQFWLPDEINMAADLNYWNSLAKTVQDSYIQTLQVLTFLDSHQGVDGASTIQKSYPEASHIRKATLLYIAMTEASIHAKSYSNIFMSYIDKSRIDDLFRWGENNESLQYILNNVIDKYRALDDYIHAREFDTALLNGNKPTSLEYDIAQYKAEVANVLLETCLFYSGFYYTLYFAGQGHLTQAGEIINLIIRDESVHGVYVGLLSQEKLERFSPELQAELKDWVLTFLEELYKAEVTLTHDMYDPVGLTEDVLKFIQYNADKALMNLGYDPYFYMSPSDVNPVVMNGLNTKTKTMDNFSQKGNGYQIMASESTVDSDWLLDQNVDKVAFVGKAQRLFHEKREPKMNVTGYAAMTDNDPNILQGPVDQVIKRVLGAISELEYTTLPMTKQNDLDFAAKVLTLLKYTYGAKLTAQVVNNFLDNEDDYGVNIAYSAIAKPDTPLALIDLANWFIAYFDNNFEEYDPTNSGVYDALDRGAEEVLRNALN